MTNPSYPFRVLVIIPTYNEAENVTTIVSRVQTAQPEVHILVVDDNSPDGTGEIADKLAAEDGANRIHVMHRQEKNGLGGAYIAGFHWGIDNGYDVMVEMDADGSHAPEQLHRLLDAINDGADVVCGSRYIPGGSTVNWPKRREILSKGGNLYSRLALGSTLRDITGGYNAFRREALETIEIDTVESQGYCFQVDLKWRTVQAGFDVREVPITFVERQLGESKMSGDIVREALIKVTIWGIRSRLGLDRRDGDSVRQR